MKIISIVGARPNFMKIAPIIDAIKNYNQSLGSTHIESIIVHTGQHYDEKMSDLFFKQLGLPQPDINLEVGSGKHGWQTGQIMQLFEPILERERPDLLIVVGDVNSTIACALDSKKMQIPVAHIESGLRSYDSNMPEEINRILTDSISDLLFTTERGAEDNLLKEGVSKEKIHFVGNVMIDSLLKHKEKASEQNTLEMLDLKNGGNKKKYSVLTLHRPSNVDSLKIFTELANAVTKIAENEIVVFPAHPRTLSKIKEFKLEKVFSKQNNIHVIEPLGYLDFMNLVSNAHVVLTDSGGIQEETTILGVPCLTLRENTERPITITEGTNKLVGVKFEDIINAYNEINNNDEIKYNVPELWDGNAAKRIVAIIVEWGSKQKN
jgi:UDP-N-acetylglucosamine 2-epimerase (non-hydrolysing)